MADVQLGYMVLYDFMVPPLEDGSYRMTVSNDVTIGGVLQDLQSRSSFFNIEGPRFSLAPTEVAGVFPPRNGHGPFADALPHVTLYRRTLPWERELDPQNLIGNVADPVSRGPGTGAAVQPTHDTGLPWMALLLFEESEVTLLKNQPLEQVVPAEVLARLNVAPGAIHCDALEADLAVVRSILPSKEELQLLAHVRQVNTADRELAAGDSDGYFSVLVANRFPVDGSNFIAALVSLEERSDLVAADPPPAVSLAAVYNVPVEPALAVAQQARRTQPVARTQAAAPLASVPARVGGVSIFRPRTRLVCLHSWRFECAGDGTFRSLMQHLDVGMVGKVASVGVPALTDTGHLTVPLQDRAGTREQVLYRGPLAPFPLTRDPLGPYHCADQARRVAPDSGAEDVSYAAAFEVGRLLATADARLGQELMRWRHTAYRQAVAGDGVKDLTEKLAMTPPPAEMPVSSYLSLLTAQAICSQPLVRADVYGLDNLGTVPGLDPQTVQATLGLASLQQAVELVTGAPGALGATVAAPPALAQGPQSIDAVAQDAAALERLASARATTIGNLRFQAGVVK